MVDNFPQNGNSFNAENQDNHNENKNVEFDQFCQNYKKFYKLGYVVG